MNWLITRLLCKVLGIPNLSQAELDALIAEHFAG